MKPPVNINKLNILLIKMKKVMLYVKTNNKIEVNSNEMCYFRN